MATIRSRGKLVCGVDGKLPASASGPDGTTAALMPTLPGAWRPPSSVTRPGGITATSTPSERSPPSPRRVDMPGPQTPQDLQPRFGWWECNQLGRNNLL